jgi:hypothetical protein
MLSPRSVASRFAEGSLFPVAQKYKIIVLSIPPVLFALRPMPVVVGEIASQPIAVQHTVADLNSLSNQSLA